MKKDTECHVAMAEAVGQEDTINDADLEAAEGPIIESNSKWCCLHHIISLQDDFVNKKPMIQHFLKEHGHICIFYLKFHCELNSIEMLWGYAKYCEFVNVFYYAPLTFTSHQDSISQLTGSFQRPSYSFPNVLTWLM